MFSLTASALPSYTRPSDSTFGVDSSVITTPRPCWPPTAPLATVILPPCLTQVTDCRSSPARSAPSTLTAVLPPVLTLAVVVLLAAAGLSFEQPTTTAPTAASPTAPAITRLIVVAVIAVFPSISRRPDGSVVPLVKAGATATDPKNCRLPQVTWGV